MAGLDVPSFLKQLECLVPSMVSSFRLGFEEILVGERSVVGSHRHGWRFRLPRRLLCAYRGHECPSDAKTSPKYPAIELKLHMQMLTRSTDSTPTHHRGRPLQGSCPVPRAPAKWRVLQ